MTLQPELHGIKDSREEAVACCLWEAMGKRRLLPRKVHGRDEGSGRTACV